MDKRHVTPTTPERTEVEQLIRARRRSFRELSRHYAECSTCRPLLTHRDPPDVPCAARSVLSRVPSDLQIEVRAALHALGYEDTTVYQREWGPVRDV